MSDVVATMEKMYGGVGDGGPAADSNTRVSGTRCGGRWRQRRRM